MKKIYFILVISVVSVVSFSQTRITGGYEIDIKDAPWQVLLKQNGEFSCGGSILAKRYVLTARYYVENSYPSDIKVVVGVNCKNLITNSNIYDVSRIILHPTLDAALLELSRDILFGTKQNKISYVESLNSTMYSVRNEVRVSGWGWLTPMGFDPASCLEAVDVKMISNDEANEMLSDISNSVSENECATIGVGKVGQGACHGDSGGPLSIWNESLTQPLWTESPQV